MAIQEEEWNLERDRLQQVKDRIEQEIERMEGIVEHRGAEVLDIRRNFWDEISVNMANDDDLAETAASITQQQAVLSQQERSVRHAESNLDKLLRLQRSPYFARVDFTEKGTTQIDPIYIGIGSIVDEDTHELLIYDWRAPISGMFYDYTPGPAQYKIPDGGTIEGEITLKRQYIIKNGQLKNMFDTGISIGDEILQVLMARGAHDKMSSIVTSIQREQNQIIRDDDHEILIVQGAAGSGKTSVALQRVAYLLYKYRLSLSADQMVLFSPNSIFNDYVSNVLPELGEANMRQTTFQDHVERGFEEHDSIEDAYDQLEFLLSGADDDPKYRARMSGIEWKTSLEFMLFLNHYRDWLKEEGVLFRPIVLGKKELVSNKQLTELFYDEYGHDTSISSRIDKIKDRVLEQLDILEERVFRNRFRKMKESPNYLGTDKEMKTESRRRAKKAFAPLRDSVKKLKFVDGMGMYKRLFTDSEVIRKLMTRVEGTDIICSNFKEIAAYTVERLEGRDIPYEDTTPIVYLKATFEGMPTLNRIKQVIIDEAQDYSPFQLEYIRQVFPRSRFTLLGDLNQGIYHANAESYRQLEDLFGEADVGIIRMAKSYRSTDEIIKFTKCILHQAEPVEPIGRSGEPPKVIAVRSNDDLPSMITEGIRTMLRQGAETIAVISKSEQESQMAYEALTHSSIGLELHLLTKNTQNFVSGVVVVPAYLAKGLEFDGVIVYNAGAEVYHRESERKLLYTACTRAMHQLWVYYTGELTPLIKI
jgi:DNA helicase-2/ATP-dependent DNA helicase PcrA